MNQSIRILDLPDTGSSTRRFKGFRILKGNELPKSGDLVVSQGSLEPWEGPTGFRADAFVKPIYRPDKRASRNVVTVVFSGPTKNV